MNLSRKKTRLSIPILCIPVALIWSVAAYAVPTISGISGTVANGQNVVISGSGFGTKSPVAPYFWDDFEGGTIGQSILGQTGTVGASSWQKYTSGVQTGSMLYSTEGYRGHGAKKSPFSGDNFYTGYISGLNSSTMYGTYKWKWSATQTTNGVMKPIRFNADTGVYTGTPSLLGSYFAYASWFTNIQSRSSTSGDYAQIDILYDPSSSSWHRLEGYIKLSNSASGSYFIGTPKTHASANNVVTRSSGSANMTTLILPFEVANDSSNTYTMWADDVYIDNTQARVEICNTSTWAAKTNCEIQIPNTTWNDGTIQVKVNEGQFKSGDTAYLYVIDANGNVSSGMKVIVESGSASSAPLSPANLRAAIQ